MTGPGPDAPRRRDTDNPVDLRGRLNEWPCFANSIMTTATELDKADYTTAADDSGAGRTGQQKESAFASSFDGEFNLSLTCARRH